MAGNRLQGRSRIGIPPALRDILQFIENPDTTTSIDFAANLVLNADDRYIAFGVAGNTDSYIMFDGGDLVFYDSTVGVEKTLTQLMAAVGSSLDEVFDVGKVIDGATSNANSMQVGGTNDKIQFWEEGSNDVRINTTAGADLNLDASGNIAVLSDATKLGFGAAGITDSYIYCDGTDLIFYDVTFGGERTLSQLASNALTSPTVTGDMTITDGKIVWTDTTDEIASLLTSSSTSNDIVKVVSATLTTGAGVAVHLTEATLAGGYYFKAYDNTAAGTVFGVKEDGEIEITGAAASDMLTITAGNLQLDNGKIEIDTTQDITSYIKGNIAGSNPIVEIEQTHVGSTATALLVDQNGTGNAKGIDISHDGDLAAIHIAAGNVRTGNVMTIPMANQLAETALDITGAATGTATEGIVHLDLTGVLAGNAIRVDSTGANAATGQLLYLLSTGKQAGATSGICGYFEDTGAATATSYAVYISSTNNEALHVDAGVSLFDERVTITLADNTGPALAITNPDTTGDTNAVTITPSGAGAGLLISPQEADTVGMKITTIASSTVPILELDLTTGAGWIGAANKGAVDLNCDGTAAHVDSTLLRLAQSGTNISGQNGMCLRIEDTSASGGGTEYAAYISSTNNEALHVASGKVVVDEIVQATGGVITKAAITDVADPPTQANMVTAFGAASQGAGMLGFIDDANGGTTTWLCVSDGTNWFYMTKLIVGA